MMAHLVGRPLEPPPAATVRELLALRAESARPWLFFYQGMSSPTPLSFADADALASRWAVALREAGVGHGDRVALVLPNGPDFIGAFFGAHQVGATPVPLPWPVVPFGPLALATDVQGALCWWNAAMRASPWRPRSGSWA
jgi:acyl-CoA synthetase (AMP-forming)/AMP-acid ligase II